jgi:hypothetical protein
MSAIITHQFRKNHVTDALNDMVLPEVTLFNCTSSGTGYTIYPGPLHQPPPSNFKVGMLCTLSAGTGTASLSSPTIVTSISTNSFTVYPAPIGTLSAARISFTSQYYIGIGKSNPYNGPFEGSDSYPASPVPTRYTESEVRNNLIALQKISVNTFTGSSTIYGNAGYVLPRYTWSNGNYYKAWDSTDSSCFEPTTTPDNKSTVYPCYVTHTVGTQTRVYVCVASGYELSPTPKTSTVEPSTNATVLGTVGSASTDGYRWVYVSDLGLDTQETLTKLGLTSSVNTISTLDSNRFFKIYRRSTTTGTSSTISTPMSSSGAIYSCRVAYGGTGYKVGDTFNIIGDGTTTASGTVTNIEQSNGAIRSVNISVSGANYQFGNVKFTSGNGSKAIILPRIAPKEGFGYDVGNDLPAFYSGYHAKFSYDSVYPGAADVPSKNTIRQVSLIRNPVVFISASTGSIVTTRCLKYIILNTASISATEGDVIEVTSGTENGANGYIDFINANIPTSKTTVYYHQNSSTVGSGSDYMPLNPKPITAASVGATFGIRLASGNYSSLNSSTSTISSVSITPAGTYGSDEYESGTGEVIFVQNRNPIIQTPGQITALTIVTQF